MVEAPSTLLDTSVVVRYLTRDPPHEGDRAAVVITSGATLFLTITTLVEAAFALTARYQIPRDDLVEALASFVQRRNLRLLGLPKSLALEALFLCRGSKRYSFADAFLWAEARNLPGSRVLTFDRRFPAAGIHVEQLGT